MDIRKEYLDISLQVNKEGEAVIGVWVCFKSSSVLEVVGIVTG